MKDPVRNNQPAMTEMGACKYRYVAGLVRSAVLGRHPEAESLHALAVDALGAVAIKPGATAGEVDAAGRKVIERARTRVPPSGWIPTGINWTERGNLILSRVPAISSRSVDLAHALHSVRGKRRQASTSW